MRFRVFALLTLTLCFALLGCSGGWSSASGTVTLDGEPLKEGNISFVPEGQGPTAYGQIADGAFTMNTGQKSGLPAGKYKVSIARQTIPESGSSEKVKFLTPQMYAVPDTSGLTADVKPGSNRFTFPLVSKPAVK